MTTYTERQLAATIDHAILKPELTRAEVDAELDIAAEWKVFSVCVRPSDIPHAVARLTGTGVAVGTVIGFPHGTTSTATKVAEVTRALADGAVELDMVLNIDGCVPAWTPTCRPTSVRWSRQLRATSSR